MLLITHLDESVSCAPVPLGRENPVELVDEKPHHARLIRIGAGPGQNPAIEIQLEQELDGQQLGGVFGVGGVHQHHRATRYDLVEVGFGTIRGRIDDKG